MKNYYVGLDVHSRESVFVVQDDAGVSLARGAIPTTASGLLQLRDSCGLPPSGPASHWRPELRHFSWPVNWYGLSLSRW